LSIGKYASNAEGNMDLNSKYPRNSLCPCGSGKKYKHCHGVATMDWDFRELNDMDEVRIPIDDNILEQYAQDGWDRNVLLFLKDHGCLYSLTKERIVLPEPSS
jgi:uncharacterized protein YecA (UPF0149 family)